MPKNAPSPTTLRLLACVESFAHEESGTAGHDDWPGLVSVLERELLLLQRLAQEKPASTPALRQQLDQLSQRYESLSQRIDAAQVRDAQELAALFETRQRIQGVRHTYLKT